MDGFRSASRGVSLRVTLGERNRSGKQCLRGLDGNGHLLPKDLLLREEGSFVQGLRHRMRRGGEQLQLFTGTQDKVIHGYPLKAGHRYTTMVSGL